MFLFVALIWSKEQKTSYNSPEKPNLGKWPVAFREALEHAEAEVQSGKNASFIRLGMLYHANSFYKRASQIYEQILEAEKGQDRVRYLLADTLLNAGATEKGIELLKEMIALNRDYPFARFRLAEILMKRGESEEALPHYQKIQGHPELRPYVLLSQARHDLREGRQKEGMNRLKKILEEIPEFGPARSLLTGLGEKQTGRSPNRSFSGRYEQPPDPWLEELEYHLYNVEELVVVADRRATAGNYERALKLLDRAELLRPEHWKIYVIGAYIHLQQNEFDKATDQYETALSYNPKAAPVAADLSLLYRRLGHLNKATTTAVSALKQNPESYELWITLGQVQREKGEISDAISSFLKAWRLKGEDPSIARQLAELFWVHRPVEEAVPWLKKSAKLSSNDSASRAALASYFLARENLEMAENYVHQALDIEPTNPHYPDLAGQIHLAMGAEKASHEHWEEAIKHWQKSLEFNPSQLSVKIHLGHAYMKLNKKEPAQRLFKKILTHYPHEPYAHLATGDFFAWAGRPDLAQNHWEQAAELLGKKKDKPKSLIHELEERLDKR